jgi:antitoxin CptB
MGEIRMLLPVTKAYTKADNKSDHTAAKAIIQWACRRGMLELDKVLLAFCDLVFDTLNTAQQQNFSQLLQATDNDLYSWIFGDSLPQEPKLQDLSLYLRHLAKTGLCR